MIWHSHVARSERLDCSRLLYHFLPQYLPFCVRTASILKRMSWPDSSSKLDAERGRPPSFHQLSWDLLKNFSSPKSVLWQVLTREDFAARREAAENAKKARCVRGNSYANCTNSTTCHWWFVQHHPFQVQWRDMVTCFEVLKIKA